MQNYYRFIVPRLNGDDIKRDIKRHLSLVRKGIAGFIVFGGELERVREHIRRLQMEAETPLIISSDLERGLGQQLRGGTSFPPPMAIAKAVENDRNKPRTLSMTRKSFRAVALEAGYAGINTILAPVLDINTNPKNPIIATRAFGEDSETVSFFGCEMIKVLQSCGVAACGKHFPGHGDTGVDSHMKLPVIDRVLRSLRKFELKPFKNAIGCGVKMLMLGHLSVPAIDPSGIPVSLSERAVAFIRKNMRYKGILITDAMNMGGIGRYSEEEASFMALKAGVDIILHPSDPEKIVSYLEKKGVEFNEDGLMRFRGGLIRLPSDPPPPFDAHRKISRGLTGRAISVSGDFALGGRPLLIVLNDEDEKKGRVFAQGLKAGIPGLNIRMIKGEQRDREIKFPSGSSVIVAIFSETRAWKGGAGDWLYNEISYFQDKADLFVSFGSPYLLDRIKGPAKMFVYWDLEEAQEAAAEIILKKYSL